MDMLILFAVLLLLAREGRPDGMTVSEAEKELRKTMLRDYDKLTLPPGNTTITISSLSILDLEMHEESHSMEVRSLLSHSWVDTRLKWSLERHADLGRLSMDPDKIWKPDLSVYNAANDDYRLHKSELPMLVYPDGRVLFVPPVQLHFTCIMDLTYWPHDTHNCSVKIGSWVHDGFLMDLEVSADAPKFEIQSQTLNSGANINAFEWEVIDSSMTRETKYYTCCMEPYVKMIVSLQLQRSAPAYAWSVKTPALCLSILTIVLFLLPPAAGEKLTFGGLCLILDLIFIAYSSQVISHAPSHTPLILQLVCQQLVLVVVSVVVAALVVRLARDPHPSPLPTLLKSPVITLSYFLCLSNYTRLVASSQQEYAFAVKSDEVELGEEGDLRGVDPRGAYNHQWLLLAAVLDRLALLLYLVICIITLIRFSIVL